MFLTLPALVQFVSVVSKHLYWSEDYLYKTKRLFMIGV